MSAVDSIRNPEGIWINTSCFREEAHNFLKNGYYCPDPTGSLGWYEYWQEQENRCVNGYTVGGAHITGHHYFYLNFSQIQLTMDKTINDNENVTKKQKGTKKVTFPDFWDGDYNYFHCLEIAEKGCSEERLKRLQLYARIDPRYLTGGYHMIVGKARRKGFEQPHSELIMTPDGYTTMGDIQTGDLVLTPDGGSAKVLEKYDQGNKDVYELTLQDGRTIRCGKDHLWKIIEFRGIEKVVNTEFFLTRKLKRGTKGKEYYSYYLPQTQPVQYHPQQEPLSIDPYLLGLLIGDGSLTKGSCLFSTADTELLTTIQSILGEDYTIRHKAGYQYSISYLPSKQYNPLLRALKKLGLRERAEKKFIPDEYKYASVEARMELVRGLMDSDGSSSPNGSCRFSNTSEQLIDDLQFVLRGLGIRVKKTRLNNLNKGFSKLQAWGLAITTDQPIFKLKRKLKNIKPRCYNHNKIAITKVRKLEYQEASSCILIDSEEHLYLTSGFAVTHNSYKNAGICSNIYNHTPDSLTIIGAFDKKYLYPEGTMGMASEYLDFLNQHTGWAKAREFVNRPEHKKASYREMLEGIQVEKGYRSQIMAITFKDNPDAARGKDAQLILFEEAGKFNNLLDSYMATKDAMQDGRFTTGFMVIFGTGGDMEGGTRDFAQMFMNPLEYDIMPFINVWDTNAENSQCGYFHPDNLNLVGFYDKEGNSDMEAAKQYELDTRNELKRNATSSNVIQKRVQEHGLNPSECFLMVSTNDFPVVELQRRLNTVKRENLHLKEGQAGWLYRDEQNQSRFQIDLEGKTNPLWDFKPKDNDIKGAVVIYEYPVPNAPKGLYKIGHDPYRQEHASTSTSIGATYVYKGVLQGSATRNIIVATYHGRPNTSDEYNRNLVMLAELYNTEVGYENEVTEVKSYFEKKKKLHLLALQPNRVISNNIKNSKVNRVYGIHMPEKLKDAGEKYIKQWLLTEREFDEDGNKVLNLDTISDPGLLEELISYNRKGNFDRVMGFMILMMYLEEESEGKKYVLQDEKKDDWLGFNNVLFKRA